MRLEQCSSEYGSVQMVLPLFQPLRLWKPREVRAGIRGTMPEKQMVSLPKGFSMKGGFMSMAGGERRLMIAGRICKTVSSNQL
jgi:hypothetical protein